MTEHVAFLMKDLVLLAASFYLLRQDVLRAASAREPCRGGQNVKTVKGRSRRPEKQASEDTNEQQPVKRIVILGGGFAGFYAAMELENTWLGTQSCGDWTTNPALRTLSVSTSPASLPGGFGKPST
jgi:hypothetical protein